MRATFRFYAELNDHLPSERRFRTFTLELANGATISDALRLLGVPEPEVDLALAQDDRVAVYPVFEAFDLSPLLEGRPPLRRPRFAAGPGLLRLAIALRSLGFEVRNAGGLAEPGRVLLSLESPPREATHALLVPARGWWRQLEAIAGRLHLAPLEVSTPIARRAARHLGGAGARSR
jgi:uncharacterized protein